MRIIQRLEKLERLEAATTPKNKRTIMVSRLGDESSDDCIRRHGHDPDEPGVFFIILVAPSHGRAMP